MKKQFTLALIVFLFAGHLASAQFVGHGRHNFAFGITGNEFLVDLIEASDGNKTQDIGILPDTRIGNFEFGIFPGYYLNFDYSISEKFSFGFGTSYMTATIVDKPTGVYEKLTRFSATIRPLYHFVAKKEFDFYAGARGGFAFHTSEINKSEAGYSRFENTPESGPLAMFVIGFNSYFGDFVGFNLEASTGTELYALSIGFCFRY